MSVCSHKHTLFQPTMEQWVCPECEADAENGFCIEESVNDDCDKLHNKDGIRCSKCGGDWTGAKVAALLMAKNNHIECPHCKGAGTVKKA